MKLRFKRCHLPQVMQPEGSDSRDGAFSIKMAPGHPEHLQVLHREQMKTSGPQLIACPCLFSCLSPAPSCTRRSLACLCVDTQSSYVSSIHATLPFAATATP